VKQAAYIIAALLTLSLLPAELAAQQSYVCVVCGKAIVDQAAVIDRKLYHPECFVCVECGRPISGDYVKSKSGAYYHRSCSNQIDRPTCGYCYKTILDPDYISYQGKTYHKECYRGHVALKCDICGDPLGEAVITDFWGVHFHPRTAKEFPACVVCGRLITRDGTQLEPGRMLCLVCSGISVQSPERARQILESVREKLARLGIVTTTLGLRIELVSLEELNRERGVSGTSHNYAGVIWNSSKSEFDDATAVIKVLKSLPEDLMFGVVAHELMHIWQRENGVEKAPIELKEGSANWASSLIYSQMGNERGKFFLGGLEKSNDPVYGDGYRLVARHADNRGVSGVLNLLRMEAASNSKR